MIYPNIPAKGLKSNSSILFLISLGNLIYHSPPPQYLRIFRIWTILLKVKSYNATKGLFALPWVFLTQWWFPSLHSSLAHAQGLHGWSPAMLDHTGSKLQSGRLNCLEWPCSQRSRSKSGGRSFGGSRFQPSCFERGCSKKGMGAWLLTVRSRCCTDWKDLCPSRKNFQSWKIAEDSSSPGGECNRGQRCRHMDGQTR